MTVSGISNTTGANQIYQQGNANLGKDEFLKILVVQLQNQDPLNPMEDREFISQMAQFSTLEQIQNLNNSIAFNRAYDLVGKNIVTEVLSEDGETTNLIVGKVDAVYSSSGEIFLTVGDKNIKFSDKIGVVDDKNAVLSSMILSGANIIGKHVTAEVANEEGETITVSGVVEKVSIEDGQVLLTVGSQIININDLKEIKNQQ